MTKKKKKEIMRRISSYARVFLTEMNPTGFQLGDCKYNQRCHLNSIQVIKEGKAKYVCSCVAISKNNGDCYIHFVNELKNGKYQDNTWGWCTEDYDYYLVKRLTPYEVTNIGDYFILFRNTLINMHTTKLERRGIDYEDFI